MDHIHKLEKTAREKSNAKAEKSNLRAEKNSHKVKECVGRTKRCAHKIPSGRATQQTPSSPIPSSSSTEETTPQTTPQIPKRKRSSPSRVHLLCLRALSRVRLPDLPPALTKTTTYPSRNLEPIIPKGLTLIPKPQFRS